MLLTFLIIYPLLFEMTSDQPCLLVLAAGMGSRYGGLKQLDPVGPNDETIMDYSIHDACKAGFTRVVFLIREEISNIFKEKIGSKYSGIIDVDYSFRRNMIYLRAMIVRLVVKNHGGLVMLYGQQGRNWHNLHLL